MNSLLIAVLLMTNAQASSPPPAQATESAVLVFSKTMGYRHDSIADGVRMMRELGEEHGFVARHTENAGRFEDATLDNYAAVIFLSTTGDVLNEEQQRAFERYIRNGGGFVGIHAAADTEYEWPWYGGLVGARFDSHPEIQSAFVDVVDRTHPATSMLPARWERTDEWYNYQSNPRGDVHVLMTLDETTYDGGEHGDDHPIAWCRHYDGGRAFYTGGGHTAESYSEPLFRQHILGGILWAIRGGERR